LSAGAGGVRPPGSGGVNLRAIAQEMGTASSALYRSFPSAPGDHGDSCGRSLRQRDATLRD
jgi:hypothetical protein